MMRMRFLLDPRLHIMVVAALLLLVVGRFQAEAEWERYIDSPLDIVKERADYKP
jgi:hypothetical protein